MSKIFVVLSCFLISLSLVADENPFAEMDEVWSGYEKAVTKEYKDYEDGEIKAWNDMKKRISAKWSDSLMPKKKVYVEYTNNDNSRVRIDYEKGKVYVEGLVKKGAKGAMNTARGLISKAMSHIFKKKDILDSSSINWSGILKDVKSAGKYGLSAIAKRIDLVTRKSTKSIKTIRAKDKVPRELYRVSFDMVPNYVKRRASKFMPTVELWSKKYNLDPSFVLAIMRQESAFNPRARSHIPAYGLMQIVPKYAGLEVMREVAGKNIKPGAAFLYTPEKNIMVGTTYLQLLRDKYFPYVKDRLKQQFLITCSYNWGPHRIQRAFKKKRISLSMSHNELYEKLRKIAPKETSIYLKKVTKYAMDFKNIK
jgi:membrane-bound lytic murein transglycosylase C